MKCRAEQASDGPGRVRDRESDSRPDRSGDVTSGPRRWRRPLLLVLGGTLAGVVAGGAGCATTVIPPAQVSDPVTVHLADSKLQSRRGRLAARTGLRGEGTGVAVELAGASGSGGRTRGGFRRRIASTRRVGVDGEANGRQWGTAGTQRSLRGVAGLQQACGELSKPGRNGRRPGAAHQGGQEERFGHVNAELAVGFELFLVEELVER